jgi:hypothetical protein
MLAMNITTVMHARFKFENSTEDIAYLVNFSSGSRDSRLWSKASQTMTRVLMRIIWVRPILRENRGRNDSSDKGAFTCEEIIDLVRFGVYRDEFATSLTDCITRQLSFSSG